VNTSLNCLTGFIFKLVQKSVDGSFCITIMRTSSLTGIFSGQPIFKIETNNRRV